MDRVQEGQVVSITQIVLGLVVFIICGWVASLGMGEGGCATFVFLGIASIICVLAFFLLGIPQWIVYDLIGATP